MAEFNFAIPVPAYVRMRAGRQNPIGPIGAMPCALALGLPDPRISLMRCFASQPGEGSIKHPYLLWEHSVLLEEIGGSI